MSDGTACYYASPADADAPFLRGTATESQNDVLVVCPENRPSETLQVPSTSVFPRHEADEDVADNAQLTHLNEASLLANLIRRYDADSIYTYTGTVLHALNPYKQLPSLYDEETRDAYRGKALGVMPPHVYAVADRARRMIVSEKKDQSIVVSGESGAGKTESCRAIVEHSASGRKGGFGLGATPLLTCQASCRTYQRGACPRPEAGHGYRGSPLTPQPPVAGTLPTTPATTRPT